MAPARACLIATMKDEALGLLEWVAHHRAIGFAPIAVASNDCADGTDAMLDRLQALGEVIHVPNPAPHLFHRNIQRTAYRRIRALPEVAGSDWIMALDADEFLNIHLGDGSVTALIGHVPPATDTILVNWRMFGDSGRSGIPDMPVCEAFTMACSRASAAEHPYRRQVKHLYRNHSHYPFLSEHGGGYLPDTPPDRRLRRHVVLPSGEPVDPAFYDPHPVPFPAPADAPEWTSAQINHYAVKTRAMMRLRDRRGAILGKPKHRLQYFRRHNLNEEEDRSIARTAAARSAYLAGLLADPVLSGLQAAAIRHHTASLRLIRQGGPGRQGRVTTSAGTRS